MNEQLKKDLDRVWQLSNEVSLAAVSERLRDVVRKMQEEDDRREKTEAEIRQEPEFQTIAGALQSAGIADDDAAFAVYRQVKEKERQR